MPRAAVRRLIVSSASPGLAAFAENAVSEGFEVIIAGAGGAAHLPGMLAAGTTLPVLGEVHLPSAFFFDLGVFSLVVGATGLILIALAHQSVRRSWS